MISDLILVIIYHSRYIRVVDRDIYDLQIHFRHYSCPCDGWVKNGPLTAGNGSIGDSAP